MALLPAGTNMNLKRSASAAGFHDLTSTKMRRTQTHLHKLRRRPVESISQVHAFQDHTHSQTLLERSIALALEAVGFDAAEPLALQSFRMLAEECERPDEKWLMA